MPYHTMKRYRGPSKLHTRIVYRERSNSRWNLSKDAKRRGAERIAAAGRISLLRKGGYKPSKLGHGRMEKTRGKRTFHAQIGAKGIAFITQRTVHVRRNVFVGRNRRDASAASKKAWATRKKLYGKSGVGKRGAKRGRRR